MQQRNSARREDVRHRSRAAVAEGSHAQKVQFGCERITIPKRIVFTRTGLAFAALAVVPIQQRLDALVGSGDATGS